MYRSWMSGILSLGIIVTIARRHDGQDSTNVKSSERDTTLAAGRLIPARAAMDRAWDIPRNPLTDSGSLPSDKDLAERIRRGFSIFMRTPENARRISGNAISCNNCHPNGGQREHAMPLVGLSIIYPEYNKRAGRVFSLEDRIVGCFLRSCNGSRVNKGTSAAPHENDSGNELVSSHTPEVIAVAAYIAWLSNGFTAGDNLPWRRHATIAADNLIPIEKLDTKRGKKLFIEKCTTCHGSDGQGVSIGDKRPGPLWGSRSWNDGAGAARTYTLAGIIRYMMPYLDPGNLTDEEAQQIAAYITSKSRPQFPGKEKDYRNEPIPIDAVYYPKLYKSNPLRKGKS